MVVGEHLAHEPERCPANLVDLVVRSELAAHRLHRPVTNQTGAALPVGVMHLGKFLSRCAPKACLLTNLAQRALERGLAPAPPALRKRPVLAMRSVYDEHLVAMPVGRAPHDPTSGLDHDLNVRYALAQVGVIVGERRSSRR